MSSQDKTIQVVTNGHPGPDGNVTIKVVIDLEEHCHNGKPHPAHDPGTVLHYLVKVDEHKHEVTKAHQTGHSLLALAGKTATHFLLEQVSKHHGESESKLVEPDQVIDLSGFGVERFVTKPKPRVYEFFVGPKRYETTKPCLTVREILVGFAGVDPATKTLALKQGSGFHEYKDLNEEISVEHAPHFILFDNASTPVS